MDPNLSTLDKQLFQAIESKNEHAIRECIQLGADASAFFSQETGESALMKASGLGLINAVTVFLKAGAPWNALDRHGRCAGDYALAAGHQVIVDELLSAGVKSELVFGALTSGPNAILACAPRNQTYLESPAVYENQVLLESTTKDAVMMEWERPLMQAHAQALCGPGRNGRVLNVGFGMGIIDSILQEYTPSEHTIIEAHPDVLREMKNRGWYNKPNVRIIQGRWQDVYNNIGGPFDAIFFDTFGEHLDDLREFHRALPRLLSPVGAYSFFNGMCPFSFFFQAVACEVVRLELLSLGILIEFHRVEVDAGGDETWANVSRRYFCSNDYYLPLAVRTTKEDMNQQHRRDKKRVFNYVSN